MTEANGRWLTLLQWFVHRFREHFVCASFIASSSFQTPSGTEEREKREGIKGLKVQITFTVKMILKPLIFRILWATKNYRNKMYQDEVIEHKMTAFKWARVSLHFTKLDAELQLCLLHAGAERLWIMLVFYGTVIIRRWQTWLCLSKPLTLYVTHTSPFNKAMDLFSFSENKTEHRFSSDLNQMSRTSEIYEKETILKITFL